LLQQRPGYWQHQRFSYATPSQSLEGRSSRDWFAEVVASELRPLLHEYWFDTPDVAEREADRLLEGW